MKYKGNKKIIFGMFALLLSLFFIQGVFAISEVVQIDDYEIEYSYSGAEDDDEFTLTVEIKNIGNKDKEEVFFELDPNSPFDVKGNDDWKIDNLKVDESVSESFRIEVDKGTDEGNYDLDFKLEDSDDDYKDEFEIEINSNKADLIIGNVVSFPLTIVPDEEDIKLEISFENIGGGDADFVRVKLILPSGFVSSNSYSDIFNLGTIKSGESKTATFYIDTSFDLESGLKTGQLEIEYKTDNDKKTENLDFDLPVRGKPLFSIVSSSVSPLEVYPDSKNSLKIDIINVGDKKAKETSIRVFENSDLPLKFDEKTNFIGTLDKGASGSAIFDFEVDSDAKSSNYLVKIQIRTLSDDNIFISEHNVPVSISEKENSSRGVFLIFSFIVFFGLFLVFAIRLSKKSKKNKNAEF